MNAKAPYGPELNAAVELVQSVPGAPPVSTESINIKVGSAYKKGKKTISYGTLPKKCPKGGFPVEVGNHVRHRRDGDLAVQGALPQEIVASPPVSRDRAAVPRVAAARSGHGPYKGQCRGSRVAKMAG